MEVILAPLIGVLVIGGLVALLVLTLVWQRMGLSTQQSAMSHIEESLELARRAVELQKRANALYGGTGEGTSGRFWESLRHLGGRDAAESGIRA